MQVFKLARIKKYNSLPCILHGMLRRLGLILYPLICFGRATSSYSVFKVKCICASATNTVQTQGLYVLSKQSTQAQHIYLSIKIGHSILQSGIHNVLQRFNYFIYTCIYIVYILLIM